MYKFSKLIAISQVFLLLFVSTYIGTSEIAQADVTENDKPFVTIVVDPFSPTDHVIKPGSISESIVRFFVIANNKEVKIKSATVYSKLFSELDKFSIDSSRITLTNETDDTRHSFEWRDIKNDRATIIFAEPIHLRKSDVVALHINAYVKKSGSAEGQISISKIELRDSDENKVTSILHQYKNSYDDYGGNRFIIRETGDLDIDLNRTGLAVKRETGKTREVIVDKSQKDAAILTFILDGDRGTVSLSKFLFVIDPQYQDNLFSNIRIQDEDGEIYYQVDDQQSSKDLPYIYFSTNKPIVIDSYKRKKVQVIADITQGAFGSARLGVVSAGFDDYITPYSNPVTISRFFTISPVYGERVFVNNYDSDPLEKSLYLKFDGNLNDEFGHEPINTEDRFIKYKSGVLGEAASFTGGSYVEYSCRDVFNDRQGTVEALIKMDNLKKYITTNRIIFHTDDSRYVLYYQYKNDIDDHRLVARAGGDTSEAIFLIDQSEETFKKFAPNEWHHVAMTWLGWNEGSMDLYLDGQRVASNSYHDGEPCETMRIGANYRGSGRWDEGLIDELKVHQAYFDENKIKEIYESYGLSEIESNDDDLDDQSDKMDDTQKNEEEYNKDVGVFKKITNSLRSFFNTLVGLIGF